MTKTEKKLGLNSSVSRSEQRKFHKKTIVEIGYLRSFLKSRSWSIIVTNTAFKLDHNDIDFTLFCNDQYVTVFIQLSQKLKIRFSCPGRKLIGSFAGSNLTVIN